MRARSVSLVLSCLVALGAALPAQAKDDSGMDSIWLDAPQPAPAGELPDPTSSSGSGTKSSSTSKSTRTAVEAKVEQTAEEAAAAASETAPAAPKTAKSSSFKNTRSKRSKRTAAPTEPLTTEAPASNPTSSAASSAASNSPSSKYTESGADVGVGEASSLGDAPDITAPLPTSAPAKSAPVIKTAPTAATPTAPSMADSASDDDGSTGSSALRSSPATTTSTSTSRTNAGGSPGSTATSTGGTTPPNTVAAMVTLDSFKTSPLVSKGGWPGVGPFKEASSPLELSDTSGNSLKVDVNGAQVTRAELSLQQPGGDFLDVQMNADFLLESVGVKPKKIVEFNEQLEKNRALVTNGGGMPNMTVGRYFIAIQRQGSAEAPAYNISVNSLDADKTALQSYGGSETPVKTASNSFFGTRTSTPPNTPVKATQPGAGGPDKTTPTKNSGSASGTGSNGGTSTTSGSGSSGTNPPTTGKPSGTGSTSQSPTPGSSGNGSGNPSANSNHGGTTTGGDAMKESFATLIRNWQNLKKTAVRTKQTSELQQFLSGRALARQSDAIKWLVANKKYYDISPKSIVVEKYTPLVADKKYTVQTVIKEQSKLVADDGAVVSDKEDTYKVNYTVEKIGDRWFIVDSALNTTAAPKPQAGGKTTR